MFAPNFDPLNPAERAPAAARVRFVKKRLSKLTSILDPILVPTWPHFATQNRPKSNKKPIQKIISFLIDFAIDFWTVLAPFWDPCWSHLGHLEL